MALRPYFKNGVFSSKKELVSSESVQAISIGLVRYLGVSREAKSGAEIPTSILLSSDGTKQSKRIVHEFEDAFETIGLEVGNAGRLEKAGLEVAFFKLGFDAGIYIREKDDEIEIEFFERGDEIGGIEAALPGGVNYRGKAKKVDHALPIPQVAVNQIEHALNMQAALEYVKPAELVRDLEKEARMIWENSKEGI